jgi:hypothetical protein
MSKQNNTPANTENTRVKLDNPENSPFNEGESGTDKTPTLPANGERGATSATEFSGIDQEGNTPLHRAVLRERGTVAKLLLSHRADANVKDNNGDTPLHLVIKSGKNLGEYFNLPEIVSLLIANGADVNAKNNAGDTPIRIAEMQKNWKVAEYRNTAGDWNTATDYFRFIESGLPPTNNLCEQSIRRVVIDRKVTQGTRSDWGNRWLERFWSVLSTCEQRGKNVMVFLKSCMDALILNDSPFSKTLR